MNYCVQYDKFSGCLKYSRPYGLNPLFNPVLESNGGIVGCMLYDGLKNYNIDNVAETCVRCH